ncbi:MAG: nucleotide exchange factor GrpE [Acidimicrobiia bacterium]|nr:nucleotide exchange factor GrpE [Acidimicrobiia bacterium]
MNDQVNHGEELQDDLTVPELNPPGNGETDFIEPVPEEDVELLEGPDIGLPEDAADAVPVLLSALGTAQAESAEYLEALQRVAAEFENFRKRSAREREEIIERASQRLIERLLPTLDSFDAALAYQPQTETEEKFVAGMEDTHRQLMEALALDGFEPIAANGVPFDPAVHEAVTGPGGEGEGDLIVKEMRRGYTLRGRVVRAALVAVEHA